MSQKHPFKVSFAGTGNIAAAHAEALKELPHLTRAGVFDLSRGRAEDFARKHGFAEVYDSLEELIASDADVVHVLTPPPAHYAGALPLLEAGKSVLVEKPIAVSSKEAEVLVAAAQTHGAKLRTNQNFIFHPAHVNLRRALKENRMGPVRRAMCSYVMPLRQLAAGQFGHWMFNSPLTLLLEQVVHPLSQLDDLMGPLALKSAVPGPVRSFAGGIELVTAWSLVFESRNGPVQMQFSLGDSYHDWSISLFGDDGILQADYLANQMISRDSGAWLEPVEQLRSGLIKGADTAGQAFAEAGHYLAAQTGLAKRSDSFFRSIRGGVRDFYTALETGGDDLDGARGARLVRLCEDIATHAPVLSPQVSMPAQRNTVKADCVIIGGTGFIGRALVKKAVKEGRHVRVIARNTDNLPDVFSNKQVELRTGSAGDSSFLQEALKDVPVVINLAHGGGGETYEEIERAMLGSAEKVAEAALGNEVERLLHVSSIAALYLGEAGATITSETAPDAIHEQRADYARAKVATEYAMLKLHREQRLPVSIYRPGLVVGEGTSPFHSGVGLYNRERYCLGWNNGHNPLPFVLVEDVADALYTAAFAVDADEISGRAFNLVGDVRLSAREYTAALAKATGRPLRFRAQMPWLQQGGEIIKWGIKKITRREVPFPSMRDLKSRGLVSTFDIDTEKKTLNWHPVADPTLFHEKAIAIHTPERYRPDTPS